MSGRNVLTKISRETAALTRSRAARPTPEKETNPTTPMWGGAPGRFSFYVVVVWRTHVTEVGWCLESSGNGVSHLC